MLDHASSARLKVLALIGDDADLTPAIHGPADQTDAATERRAIARARAAHDRIDTLLMGRAAAARKRIQRLLGPIEDGAVLTADAPPVLATPEDAAAAQRAKLAHSRIAALLAPAA